MSIDTRPEAAEHIVPPEEVIQDEHHPFRVRQLLGAAAATLTFGLLGGGIGLAAAMNSDAHLTVAGTPASVHTTARNYDELNVNNGALTFKHPNHRMVAGESFGAELDLKVDFSDFLKADGKTDARLLPVYLSLFSDTHQVSSDIEWSIIDHDLLGLGVGAAVGAAAYGLHRWRKQYHHDEEGSRFRKRVAMGLIIGAVIMATPASDSDEHAPKPLNSISFLADTPAGGIEIGGWMQPVIPYAEGFVQKYFAGNDKYYGEYDDVLKNYLKTEAPALPTGEDIETFGFITDKHCNIGMDRLIVTLMTHYGIKTLASAGDDALSADNWGFEAACTDNLAEREKKAGIKEVAIGGNHDGPVTEIAEKKKGVIVVNGKIATVNGISFIGEHDPRQSYFGKEIQPSDVKVQDKLNTEQALALGAMACRSGLKLVLLLHDPDAGRMAVRNGCGNIMIALDGHQHVEHGPTSIDILGGASGYQFTGASAGGAPSVLTKETDGFLDDVTIGVLKHDASVYFVSEDKNSGALEGLTKFILSPNKKITVEQQVFQTVTVPHGDHPIGAPKPR